MEQTRYWMWARNKLVAERVPSAAHVNHEYSWEEQAFAEDSAGPHGGCIWPPRSYTCSFCRREFRSAQALGGHMNVHRRDRARLKLSPSTPQPPSHHENNSIHQNPFTSSTSSSSLMGTIIHQHPSDHVRNRLVYSPSMIHNPDLAVASSPNRVSAASSAQENCISTQTLVSPLSYTSSIVHTESLSPTALTRRSEPVTAARFLIVSDSSNLYQDEGEKLRERETAAGILRHRVHDQKLNSSVVSLNLVSFSGNRPTRSDGADDDDDDDEEAVSMISNKRRKTSNTLTLPFFLKANFIDRDRLKSEGTGLINKQSSMEDELDLELRLGA